MKVEKATERKRAAKKIIEAIEPKRNESKMRINKENIIQKTVLL